MIAMRRRLMQHFAATPTEPVPELAKAQMDNALLRQMNEIIEENIDNPDFNVQMLAERLNISRSGLFAKVKAITDITPNEMIQIVRLRKAARLLKTKQYRVSEVAYQVGFNPPTPLQPASPPNPSPKGEGSDMLQGAKEGFALQA